MLRAVGKYSIWNFCTHEKTARTAAQQGVNESERQHVLKTVRESRSFHGTPLVCLAEQTLIAA